GMEAFGLWPAPPWVVVTCTLLFFRPAVVPCTFREIVHEALGASVPPERLAEPEPPVAVTVPPQVLVTLGVDATTMPAGKLSVKAMPFRVTVGFGLLILNVSEGVPFKGM